MKLTVNGIFKIQKQQPLNGEDYSVLVKMYLPIIGIDGFALYHLLNVFDDKDTCSFKKLLDALNFSSVSFLNQAFSKLEASNLIAAHYNKQKESFLYVVKPPFTIDEFFSSPVLVSFLQSQIGEVELKKLLPNKSSSIRGYDNITRTFDKVFTATDNDIQNIFSKIFALKNPNRNIKINYDEFDYIFFKMSFDDDFLDSKLLDDEDFKQNIINIAFMYKLNEEEMIEVIKKTMTINKDLKYDDLSKNARTLFQKKYKSNEPRFVTKEPDTFLGSSMDNETYRLLEKIDTTTPADLLEELSGIKPSVSELKMIEDLVKNTKFPISVIIIMIVWISQEKSGEIPGYNYFEKIANTWARANIKTPLDALNHITKEQKTKTTYQKRKRVTPLPDWYEKYQEQLSSIPKEESLSPEEVESIMEKMKKKGN